LRQSRNRHERAAGNCHAARGTPRVGQVSSTASATTPRRLAGKITQPVPRPRLSLWKSTSACPTKWTIGSSLQCRNYVVGPSSEHDRAVAVGEESRDLEGGPLRFSSRKLLQRDPTGPSVLTPMANSAVGLNRSAASRGRCCKEAQASVKIRTAFHSASRCP